MKEIITNKYECKKCEGTGIIQSEYGDHSIDCPVCDGSGKHNPYA